ncbi:unnamed protein product, partial [Bubo scandiacus]
ISFWLKSKTKNVKRERSRVLRSVSNLRRRLQEIVPNGSVYPWVPFYRGKREKTMKKVIHAV